MFGHRVCDGGAPLRARAETMAQLHIAIEEESSPASAVQWLRGAGAPDLAHRFTAAVHLRVPAAHPDVRLSEDAGLFMRRRNTASSSVAWDPSALRDDRQLRRRPAPPREPRQLEVDVAKPSNGGAEICNEIASLRRQVGLMLETQVEEGRCLPAEISAIIA